MIGCLCIHGFTGAPYEVEPLALHLQEVTDWEIQMVTLPGHGEELVLKGVFYQEWIEHAEQAIEKLLSKCEKVYVIGFSMGGLIASYLSTKYPVEKLVLLSAAVYYVNPKRLFADIGGMIRDTFRGKLKENDLFLRYKKKIKNTPFSATMEFRKLVQYVRPLLQKIQVPVLIVQGEVDGIVPVKSAFYLYEKIPSPQKELMFLPGSHHHVCHGCDFEDLVKKVDEFLIGESGNL
ncbi:alpha/beta hydrolase [Metabacillus arenae]|uniref:Alpha/beta fold hydrolase n=1 Tax=Metabacillus arenae TaxID=2771434 RepID=A0A926RYJ8_9BACI|nr:alpha/beta fold hydrolase [Metabacillus arenae]MBD1382156.1 alpha/beta fold hydrolase [Metabacillus arenae]